MCEYAIDKKHNTVRSVLQRLTFHLIHLINLFNIKVIIVYNIYKHAILHGIYYFEVSSHIANALFRLKLFHK